MAELRKLTLSPTEWDIHQEASLYHGALESLNDGRHQWGVCVCDEI